MTQEEKYDAKYTCYYIKNNYNNKRYVGVTANLKNRILHHFGRLKAKKHSNPHLQFDYDLFEKFDNPFSWGILEENISAQNKFQTERNYIAKLKTYDETMGYNIAVLSVYNDRRNRCEI